MKTALSRILEFFVGHDRREKNNPAHRDYCICGAPKPAVKRGLEDAAKHLAGCGKTVVSHSII
jgi:hypothetical protein